ncbi:Inner membrane protein YqjF [Sulfitobacter sp. THAF37]|uniref:DoxX family protein n=1 Tax=Sulfitobacter sp. THAF37 TaxID=2587855 RepID=UPI0012AA39BE|nr:DoxX family protein [Sulfitobacter sp. THAF37]QFT59070.1 Inner membrane protein YqjF [Sulfitobacter sp. THAF37]
MMANPSSLSHRRILCADALLLMGRFCIAALFVTGAAQKIYAPEVVQQLLATRAWPEILIWPAVALNLAGGVLLVTGFFLMPTALILAGYCMVTSLFHFLPDDPWQMSIFVKNWAIAGGLLALAAAELRTTDR